MAPIRRYLRITKYSVLEVRIYLQRPSDVTWLLSSRDNVLPRIIEEIRPKVLPKLREENENAKKKGGKKKRGVKDVASQEDFEVSIFLKENSTRHSLLTKQKGFSDKPKIKSTSSKLTGWLNTSEDPIRIDEDRETPGILQEEDDEVVELKDVPEAGSGNNRKSTGVNEGDEDEALFVSSSDDEFFATQRTTRRKRTEDTEQASGRALAGDEEQDDKKKLLLDTSYDGFSIYERVLCLIVTRKGKREATGPGSSQMMEQWVSTQAAQEDGLLDDDDG